jgi:hypothetical protein
MKRTILALIVFLTPAIAQQPDQCQCACVNGKVEAVCSSTIAIKPVCAPRVCDIVPPSIKPIDTPTIPPIGTDKCDLKQVLNEQTHEYEWRRLCYKEDPNQTAIQPSSGSVSQPSTNTTNNGTANDSGALGQAVGSAIGTAIAGSIQNHRINSFCKANPTSTYVTDTGLRIDCPSASLSSFEQSEVDEYCADNPGSWIAFGKHRVDCLTPPNPPNLKWAKWELKAWEWDYKNPKKISLSLTQDQMRSNWSYWQQQYCTLSGLGTRFKDLEGKKQRCP